MTESNLWGDPRWEVARSESALAGYRKNMPNERFDFLADRMVEQIWVWADTVRLVIDLGENAAPSMYVDINTASELTDGDSRATLDIVALPDEAGAVFRLLNRRVVAAAAEDGVLRISFAGGPELRSPFDEQFESWTVVGEGRVYQCLPGGEVGCW